MAVTYYSITSYEYDGVADPVFYVGFPFIRKEDVFVYLNGAELFTQNGGFEWESDDSIRILTGMAVDDQLVFRRFTRKDVNWTTFANGANLTEGDLNIVSLQHLYLIQELSDWGLVGSDPNPPPGQIGDPEDPNFISQVANDVLNTEAFQQLVELIPLVDINAETVISNSLKNHEDWSTERYTDDIQREQGGQITVLEDTTDTHATRITNVESDLNGDGGIVARVTNVELTKVDAAEATALAIQEIAAKFANWTPGGGDALSSFIEGVEATAGANGADIEGITSYIVGTGDINQDGSLLNPAPGSLADTISGYQETLTAHADDLSTNAEFRQAMFSAFYPAGNPDDQVDFTPMLTAMSETWETYVDSESALAERVFKIETNSKPVLFSPAPPNHQQAPYVDTQDWGTAGFPTGTVWFKQNVDRSMVRYVWDRASSGGIGPYGAVQGSWFRSNPAGLDGQDLAGAVQTIESAYMDENAVEAFVETQVQVVGGTNVGAVNERVQAFLRKPDPNADPPVEGGLLYTGWDVRVNQTLGDGQPVIAGMALGMQSDPDNPEEGARSDIIMMADHFSVVAPPAAGSFVDGVLDNSLVKVPFTINAQTGDVMVNGDLFVEGTFSAYMGYMGHLVFTELTLDAQNMGVPVNPAGNRMECGPGLAQEGGPMSPFTGGPQAFWLWAGNQSRNHNSASFYVDTDGNAHFDGEISAENVTGSINDAQPFTATGGTISNITSPTVVGTSPQLIPSTPRARKPFAMVQIPIFGSGSQAGRGYLEIRYEISPGVWSGWQSVVNHALATPTGTTLSLSGGLNATTTGGMQCRALVGPENGNNPSSNGFTGLMMLTG